MWTFAGNSTLFPLKIRKELSWGFLPGNAENTASFRSFPVQVSRFLPAMGLSGPEAAALEAWSVAMSSEAAAYLVSFLCSDVI